MAQAEDVHQYSVDLNEEELKGGHTKRDHVGKTDDYLFEVVKNARYRGPLFTIAKIRESSFLSLEAANDFVNRTLESQKERVDAVAAGQRERDFVKHRFGYVTGREAFRPDADSDPLLRNTYNVGAEIRKDVRSPRRYRVHTAYPFNEQPGSK